jgi:ribosomal protein S4E
LRDSEFFLNTQNSKIQTASIPFVFTNQRQLDKRALRPVLGQHKTRQSISIYTLIQSFLC